MSFHGHRDLRLLSFVSSLIFLYFLILPPPFPFFISIPPFLLPSPLPSSRRVPWLPPAVRGSGRGQVAGQELSPAPAGAAVGAGPGCPRPRAAAAAAAGVRAGRAARSRDKRIIHLPFTARHMKWDNAFVRGGLFV